eukprot:GFKZ01002137.1.p1 GENE.GFKZ01002137.1~~GFKZ01002137.1.p1  ORF type:complete len:263 (+),score=43.39 GFKZ01002137.1:31-789(+)
MATHSLALLLLLSLLPASLSTPTTYILTDISDISLYSSAAVFARDACPESFTFNTRATYDPALKKITLPTSSLQLNPSTPCTSTLSHLIFKPIGRSTTYPPQWLFEDSTLRQRPINFTCADTRLTIRFAYFNDVSTDATNGILDPNVVYFDFAVYPYTTPFSFCSYAGRRDDAIRPIDAAPFPTTETWAQFLNHGAVAMSNHTDVPDNAPVIPMGSAEPSLDSIAEPSLDPALASPEPPSSASDAAVRIWSS